MQSMTFDGWRLDPTLNRLEKGEEVHQLEAKMTEVLQLLLSRAGELVTREEITAVVWSDVVVGEETLNRIISMLRKILGDDPKSPQYIQTVRGKGYLFLVAPEQNLSDPVGLSAGETNRRPWTLPEENPVSLSHPEKELGKAKSISRFAPVIAVLIVLPLIYGFFSKKANDSQPGIQVAPSIDSRVAVTSKEGSEYLGSLSPDGTKVAFSKRVDSVNNYDLFVKILADGSERRLTREPGNDLRPTWSADGNHLAFFRRHHDGSLEVRVMSLLDDESRAPAQLHTHTAASAISWSQDGSWIMVPEYQPGLIKNIVIRVDLESGRKTPYDCQLANMYEPRLDLENKGFAFIGEAGPGMEDIYYYRFMDGRLTKLTNLGVPMSGFSWNHQTGGLYFTAEDKGFRALFYQEPNGQARWIAGAGQHAKHPSFAAQRLVYEDWQYEANIHRLDLEDRQSPSVPVITSAFRDCNPAVSPDGSRIAFVSDRRGRQELWLASIDGSEAKRLAPLDYLGNPAVWSPDGKSLIYEARLEDQITLYQYNIPSGTYDRLIDGSGYSPRFSQDGQRLLFTRLHQNHWSLFSLDFETKQVEQELENSGNRIYLLGNRRLVRHHRDPQVFLIENGRKTPFLSLTGPRSDPGFKLRGQTIFYQEDQFPHGVVLHRTDSAGGARSEPWSLGHRAWSGSFDLDPSGRYLYFTQTDRHESNLYLLELLGQGPTKTASK